MRKKKRHTFYFLPHEEEALQKATRFSGETMNGVVVSAILYVSGLKAKMARTIPAINQEQWGKLANLSSNLNQIAYRLNTSQKTELQAVHEALILLRQVRNTLINPPEEKEND